MAEKKSIVVLNLGSQRIGMARFSASGKGSLQLNGYAFAELGGDPATDISRVPQVAATVKGLASQLKAANSGVRYAVSAQPVLSKFVKLPPLDIQKMDELIGFEAQQAIPFPINEVSWHYQLLNKDGGIGETEAVLAAVKNDILADLNNAVEAAPLSTEGVDIAPLALYNAFRFNYPDIVNPVLLIDLGSRTTNLLYIEPGGKFFFRTINNAGGASVSSAIAKEFGVDFEEAEARKVQSGFVSLSGYADHEDPELAALSKVIRNALTRTHGEIVRTTNLYRSQQGGSAPEIVFIAGGGSLLPYAKEFFEEKLNLQVEYFDALRNVALGPKLSAESVAADRASLGELVGLALRDTLACPMELDIVPPVVALRRDNAKRKPFLYTAAACLIGLLGAGWLYNKTAASSLEAKTSEIASEKSELTNWDNKISAADKQGEKEQARASYLETAVLDRSYWLEMFNALNGLMKNDLIWLTQIQPTSLDKSVTPSLLPQTKEMGFYEPLVKPAAAASGKGGSKSSSSSRQAAPTESFIDGVHIFGLYRNYQNERQNQVVSDFFADIKASPELAKFFDINPNIEDGQYLQTESPSDTRWASSFEMRFPLKRKVKIPAEIKTSSN